MGTDIHAYAEIRTDGAWRPAFQSEPNPCYEEGEDDGERPSFQPAIYRGRNYSLFAMLADVRNGRGFAGVDIGDPVVPISDPRGLPEDVSSEIRAESEYWGADGHSHSFFTLRELLAVDWWGETITHRGWVTSPEYDRVTRFNVAPTDAYGGVAGPRVHHATNEEMSRLIADGTAPGWGTKGDPDSRTTYYTQITWTEPWVDAVPDSFFTCLLRMLALADGDPDRARLVFWFDN